MTYNALLRREDSISSCFHYIQAIFATSVATFPDTDLQLAINGSVHNLQIARPLHLHQGRHLPSASHNWRGAALQEMLDSRLAHLGAIQTFQVKRGLHSAKSRLHY